ncbi:MAG: enhanced serine sensitivity protein SseB C-terminal domain-containing protein [Clostridiales bacterium]|nr:enhanced serine sensitivity protein SseB C-terminal domain-containing protein [Clostridiales bacterium]
MEIDRIENTELVEVMGRVRQSGTEENMIELLRQVAGATLLVPVDGDEGNYSFHAVAGAEGKKYMVVYSDSDSYEVAFEGKPYKQKGVTAGFADILDVVMAPNMGLDGFVINPGVENILFGKDMLKMIAQQMDIGGDDTAKVGEPDHYPEQLKDKLEEYLLDAPSVKRIWVRLLKENHTEVLRWMIIIDTELEGDELKYQTETLRNFVKPYLDGMDALVVSSKEEFSQQVIKGVKPFAGEGSN